MMSELLDPAVYLRTAGIGRKTIRLRAKQQFFTQGDAATQVFFLQSGRVKVTIVSAKGKEATIALLGAGEFLGEEAVAGAAGHHITTATATTACIAFGIERVEFVRVLHEENSFSDMFVKFLLARGIRTQADLIDQLFNSSERRLARILLLMAEFAEPGKPETLIPPITQETLAQMIGTTRSRVSFLMNAFVVSGLSNTTAGFRVHRSLLNVVLHDQPAEKNEAVAAPWELPKLPVKHKRGQEGSDLRI